jgi:alpha-beta hydrolase superfamily lysophospholipase
VDTGVGRTDGYLDGAGGLRLHYLGWEVERPRAVVLIVHGHGEHAGRYAGVARTLTDAGCSAFALDLRGHGRSEGRRGHAARFGYYLQDLERFRAQVQATAGEETPAFLLGQSMGGLVVLRYLEEYAPRLRGAVVVSPWLGTIQPIPRWKTIVAPLLSRVLPAFPFRTHLRTEYLSHDTAAVQAYRDDPLVHDRLTPRLFTEIGSAMGLVVQRAERFHLPLLFMLAGDDRIVSTPRALAVARAVGGPAATVRVYPDFYHEPLHELGRERALTDLREWLELHL